MNEPLTQPLGDGKRARRNIAFEHIDEFLDCTTIHFDYPELAYPHFLFNHWRRPAVERMMYDPFMRKFKLFVEYEGRTWRVTGASRMGDIWLTSDFERDTGYERRVDPDFTKFSHWRSEANANLSWDQQMALAVAFYGVVLVKGETRKFPGRCIRYQNILKRAKVPKRYMETSPKERQFLHDWEIERRDRPPEPELEPQQGW